ncbi:MAG TPA: hypothetical protein VKT99_09180 [Xanthobacteraceae bacterium]|jgi:hypothetical protein|nr:hypothetical protein [Xanthobacteraceae bacterium]
MSAMPKPRQSGFLKDAWHVRPPLDQPAIRLADLKDQFRGRPSPGGPDPLGRLGRLDPLVFARYLITFSFGLAVALAWQSFGEATRETASLKAISLDHEALRHSIDRIATSVATSQEQSMRRIERSIDRGVDRLAAGQEQTMREIGDLQTVEQYLLDKVSAPPPRPAYPASRPAAPPQAATQAPLQLAPARSP